MKKLYAAYGSNLNTAQMSRRCPDAAIVGTSTLPDHRLVFRGSTGAVATVEPSPGDSVPILLWEISKSDEAALDVYEGFPVLYKKEQLEVKLDGETVSPMAYIMTPGLAAGKPSQGYYYTILEGYLECGFDPGILEQALSRSLKLAQQERQGARLGESDSKMHKPDFGMKLM